MIRNKLKGIAMLTALALAGTSIPRSAAGEPEGNGWINIGPNGAGGSIIIGPSGIDAGQLGIFTSPVFLSENGNDFVELLPGGTATSSFGATIEFESNGNGFLNYGTVLGPNEDEGVFQNTGVGFFTDGPMVHEGVINHGIISGGVGEGFEDITGAGIGFWSFDGIYGVGVVNTGLITAGSNSFNEEGGLSIGSAIVLFDENEQFDINGAYFQNSGVIAGGTNTGGAALSGDGIVGVSFGSVQNVYLVNQAGGIITGGNDTTNGYFIGSAVVFAAGASENGNDVFLNNVQITNNGSILGGNNADHTNSEEEEGGSLNMAGVGIGLWGGNGVYNVSLNNTGIIAGGSSDEELEVSGNSVNDPGFGSAANTAVAIFDANGFVPEPGDINTVVLVNSGAILGGSNGSYALIMNAGIGIAGAGNVTNVAVLNNSTGTILGGNNSEGGDFFPGSAIGGAGVGIAGDIASGSFTVSNIAIANYGLIAGGNSNFDSDIVGAGIGIWGGNGVYNVGIYNAGTVVGGNDNGSENVGAIIGDGIGISDANFNLRDINGVAIVNDGIVVGGNDNSDREAGVTSAGVGIAVTGGGNLYNIYIENNGFVSGGSNNGFADFVGDGIAVGSLTFGGTNANITVVNGPRGIVVGGNNNGEGSDGSDGIHIGFFTFEEDNAVDSNVHIVNYGLVRGGDGNVEGGNAGIGIHVEGDNTVIDNWGVVATGNGRSTADVEGFPGVAIRVEGNNNTINLNGHSSVIGTIQGINEGTNNTLNLNFTGLSPLDIQNLKNQLASQGWPGSNNFSGTFTVRGVTYYVDPINLGLNASSYYVQGVTPNQKSIGANLDSMKVNPTGDLLNLVNAIDQSGNVPRSLESLSPQPYQIYGDIAEAITTFSTLTIDHRLNNLRDGSESIDTTGYGGGSDQATAGFSKDGKDNKGTIQMNAPERHWGFFAAGSGIFANIDGHGGDLTDAGFTTAGLMLGVDGKVNDKFVVGALFNYDHTSADLDNLGSKSNIDTVGGGIYAGYHDGPWYANTNATYNHNSYDSSRLLAIPGFNRAASGSTDGNQFAFDLDGGYDFHINDHLTVGPLAGLQYMHLSVDGFNETGAGAASLAVGSQDVNSLRSRFGLHAEYKIQINKEVAFGTEAHAEWQHEFLDDSRTISAAFIGANLGNFGVRTTSPERDSALVGVGANLTVRDRVTFFVDYDAQIGQQSYTEHSIKGGLKLSW